MARKHDVDNINLKIVGIDFWGPIGPEGRNKGGMRIYWSADIGVGHLNIIKRSGANWEDDASSYEELVIEGRTDHMDIQEDKAFTKKILELLADMLVITD